MTFTRHEVLSGDIEKRIVTGLIVDNKFCREAVPILRPKYFQIDYTRKVAQWVADYWKKYKKAPGKDIQAIFQAEEKILKPAEAGIIEEFLKEISSQYENDVNFNAEYLLDQTYKYSESRSYEILKDQIEGSLLQGKLDKAAEAIRGFNKVARETSRWVNPFDKAEVDKTLDDDASDNLFRLPGALGELIGTLKREWLIAVMGPMKRGKCVSGDTKVLLENGSLITIRELVRNKRKEKIIAYNEESQRFETVKISELYDNGIKNCCEVTTRTGRKVVTTKNHQYLTPDGWKYLKNINVKDFIAVPKRMDFFGKNEIKESLIKFIAYMMAEGSCTATQPGFTNIDDEINCDFRKCCDELGIGYRRVKESYKLKNSRPFLKQFGILGKLSKNKVIPNEIMTSSKSTISTFLRIFFTCDGTIYKSGNGYTIQVALASEEMIDQISHLLLRFGIVHKKRIGESELNGKTFLHWTISIISQEYVNLFLQEIGFDEPKKKEFVNINMKRSFLDKFPLEIAKRFCKELKEECNCRPRSGPYPKGPGFHATIGKRRAKKITEAMRNSQKTRSVMRQTFSGTENTKTGRKYLNSEILWDEIVSIEDVGKMDTYDITVPKYHNFVGDDVILHNSFYAWEIVYHALIARLKVAVFSLEMNSTQFKKRIYKRMTAMAEYEGEYEYPVFDCAYNQDGSCLKEERKNRRALVLDDGTLPEYSRNSKYKPCDYCRHHDKKSYQLAWWWRTHKQKEDLSTEAIAKKVKIFKRLYGNNLRLMCHPPFSASFDDIISDLDNLEYTEGFIPDVILVDYFDITAKTSDDERSDANTKWQRGKHLAGVRRALVINCNQSNRDSIDKKNIGQKNTGEDIRKLAHVDALFVLNQLPSEKKSGRIRIDTLVHRHDEAAEKGQVIVLQQLKLGQPFLDSEWDRPKKKED